MVVTTSPTNGSATDRLLNLVGQAVDTVGVVAQARAAAATPPPPAPTSAPRIADPAANALPPDESQRIAVPLNNQWKLWAGGTLAIGAVIALTLLLARRPRGA